jgi:arsenate reductase
MRRLLTLLAMALLAVTAIGLAHEKYRIVGTVTKRQATEMHVKTKEGHAFTIYLDEKTIYQRDKKPVRKAELKVGQTVVVDALGDGDDDLGAVVVNIVPAIPSPPAAKTPPPTVLFLCPHGAAKSVLASAYFQRAAKERGLNVRVINAGIDPDPQVAPAVAAHLSRNGYSVPAAKPRRVAADEIATADVVISIGCDLTGLPTPRGQLVKWDEVPLPSQDFAGADEAIKKRVIALVEELVRKAQPQ